MEAVHSFRDPKKKTPLLLPLYRDHFNLRTRHWFGVAAFPGTTGISPPLRNKMQTWVHISTVFTLFHCTLSEKPQGSGALPKTTAAFDKFNFIFRQFSLFQTRNESSRRSVNTEQAVHSCLPVLKFICFEFLSGLKPSFPIGGGLAPIKISDLRASHTRAHAQHCGALTSRNKNGPSPFLFFSITLFFFSAATKVVFG